MPVRVGVIGLGSFGKNHARVYSELDDDVILYGVSDRDYSRAKEIASKNNCRAFKNYKEMLNGVDAVTIVTPTITHKDIALDCLKANKHIFIEKPVTTTLEEADIIIEEAKKRRLIFQVGHIERYNAGLGTLFSLMSRPHFIEAERISPFPGRGLDVDVTMDMMIHDLDIILAIAGTEIKSVNAVGYSVLSENLDAVKAWIEFESGLTALVMSGRLAGETKRHLKLFQNDSYMVLDFRTKKIIRHVKEGSAIKSEVVESEDREPLKAELNDFIISIMENERPVVSGKEGRNALALALLISDIARSKLNN